MNATYLALIAAAGATAITHIGLVDENGDELSGGSYARKAVTWAQTGGTVRPNANLEFDVPAGIVAGWQGYSADDAGTAYGVVDLEEPEEYAAPGKYTLLAASTAIHHQAAA